MKFKGACEELGFEPTPDILSKVMSLHRNVAYRTGLILLGSSETGKTTVMKVLAHALDVSCVSINPKAVALCDLFGSVMKNGEWREGLVSFLIKSMNSEQNNAKWLVFDGPIESGWIENLNSVLDDNKTLCLANSERIRLDANIRMLFEADELKNSSPATVSRCGVIFFQEIDGFENMMLRSWVEKLRTLESGVQKNLSSDVSEIIRELGERS